jgi:predicted nucleic-acid-binding protein
MIDGSISLDTSFVLRLLVAQPENQYRLASRFLQEQRSAQGSIHVADLVLAEAYFALLSFYQLPKADALAALAYFTRHSGVTVTPVARTVLALPNLASAKPGFVDRLIHGESHTNGRTLVTFEKAAKKLHATFILPDSSDD